MRTKKRKTDGEGEGPSIQSLSIPSALVFNERVSCWPPMPIIQIKVLKGHLCQHIKTFQIAFIT